MLISIKHRLIKIIESFPTIQILIYNNLSYFKFLFPHDKDYYALNILFKKDEKRTFLDVGGNIGLSTIGFRQLGFKKNKIIIFEPDKFLIKKYISKIINNYSKIKAYSFGLSDRTQKKKLYKAFYKGSFFHFNNSFDLKYLKEKLKHNYGSQAKSFKIKSSIFDLKKFDELNIKEDICFIKIDVEGFETKVVKGAEKIFLHKDLKCVIIELIGGGKKYGFDENELHQKLLNYGFNTYSYIPSLKKLVSLELKKNYQKNTLYLRKNFKEENKI